MDEVEFSGGSQLLAELIDGYGGELTADLREYYTLDLGDIFRDTGLSPGMVLVLIRNLPIGSRFYAEKRGGPEFRGWGHDSYALAAVVNSIRALTHTYVSAHSKSRPQPPKPFPVPDRPVSAGVTPGAFAQMAATMLKGD